MTPEEVDRLAGLCSEACQSETGKRLYAAMVTDGLFTRIVRDHPDPGGIAEEMGNARIIEVAEKEMESMSQAERAQLAHDAAEDFQGLVVSVSKAAFKAFQNGILTREQI